MKKAFAVALAALLALTCAACAYTPREQYENFLADLDLVTRLDICFAKVEDGRTDAYTRGELDALVRDISAWDTGFQAAVDANYLFTKSALYLQIAMDYNKGGDTEYAAEALKMARDFYSNARAIATTMGVGGNVAEEVSID